MGFRAFIFSAALSVALLGGARASAESVTFNTSYDFDSGSVVDNTAELAGGVFTLSGVSHTGLVAPATDVVLGKIFYNSTAKGSGFLNLEFDFSVAQSSPLPGGSGTSTGNDFYIAVNKLGSLAEIEVDGGSVTIGNVTYSLQDQSFVFRGNGSADILGTITVSGSSNNTAQPVPMPASVWGGFVLLGVLGSARLYVRRRDTVEA